MAVQAQYPANVIASDFKSRNGQVVDYKSFVGLGVSSEPQIKEYQTVGLPMHPLHFTPVPNAFPVQHGLPGNTIGFHAPDDQKPTKKARKATHSFSVQSKRPCLVTLLDANHHAHGPVSTGLRLAFEEDHGISLRTSSSINDRASVLSSISEDLRAKLQQEKDEMNQFLRIQEEQLRQSLLEKKQMFLSSFVSIVEEGASKCLRQKELEIERMNRKNLELEEKVKQWKVETHVWQTRARNHDVMAAALKGKLQHAVAQCREQCKEGFGDNEADDAESGFADPKSDRSCKNARDSLNQIICKVCQIKAVSILLLPCRHLCLCRDCEVNLEACPICHAFKNASLEVYMT